MVSSDKFTSLVTLLTMDFLKSVVDYFRGSNTKRDNENEVVPVLENSTTPYPFGGGTLSNEMDAEFPHDFIDEMFGGNIPNSYEQFMGSRNNSSFITNIFQVLNHAGKVMQEMERHFEDSYNFEMDNSMFRESDNTLTGESLRNYYLRGNDIDANQGKQIITLNDKETCDYGRNLIISNNRSDLGTRPHFKSQMRHVTTKVGPDGVAEITMVTRDEAGNEERTVRKMKLF